MVSLQSSWMIWRIYDSILDTLNLSATSARAMLQLNDVDSMRNGFVWAFKSSWFPIIPSPFRILLPVSVQALLNKFLPWLRTSWSRGGMTTTFWKSGNWRQKRTGWWCGHLTSMFVLGWRVEQRQSNARLGRIFHGRPNGPFQKWNKLERWWSRRNSMKTVALALGHIVFTPRTSS